MEVGSRQGVCNNSPAEWSSPENGWRSSGPPKRSRREWVGCDYTVRCRRV